MRNYDRVSKYIQATADFMREEKGEELMVSRATREKLLHQTW